MWHTLHKGLGPVEVWLGHAPVLAMLRPRLRVQVASEVRRGREGEVGGRQGRDLCREWRLLLLDSGTNDTAIHDWNDLCPHLKATQMLLPRRVATPTGRSYGLRESLGSNLLCDSLWLLGLGWLLCLCTAACCRL